MEKVLVLFHSKDLDGWFGGAIIKKHLIDCGVKFDNIVMKGWDYHDVVPELSHYVKVYIVDICLPVNAMKVNKDKIVWLDHHKSSIEKSIEHKFDDIEGYRTTNISACEIAWTYLMRTAIPDIVSYVGKYDSFRHIGTPEEHDVLLIQYGLRSLVFNEVDATGVLTHALHNDSYIIQAKEKGIVIYDYLNAQAIIDYSKHTIGTFKYKDDIIHLPVMNAKNVNPRNFNIDATPYKAVVCYSMNANGTFTFSIYSVDTKFDASKLATNYNGGGHKGAAGFVCNVDLVKNILNL